MCPSCGERCQAAGTAPCRGGGCHGGAQFRAARSGTQIATWVHDYGEDSATSCAFGLVMGVDIARQGGDQTMIRFRRGLDARSIPPVKFRIPDLMVVASRVIEQVNAHSPDAVFVDGTGIGWSVDDRLAQLG